MSFNHMTDKTKPIFGLDKIPDEVLLSMANAEIVKLQSYVEELEKEAIFITDCKTQSGVIHVAKKLPATLFNTFEDDPNELKTRKQLKENGMDTEEIEECSIEFEKGDFFIEIKVNL